MNAPSSVLQDIQRPLRIALLGYRSHPHVGGQGIYIKHISRALTELGHQVDVISGPPYPELDAGIRLVRIPSLNLYEHPNHLLALRPGHFKSLADLAEWVSMATGGFAEPYSFGRRVAHYMKQHGQHYDIIHDNQSLSHGLLKMQRAGLPVISTIHHPISRDRALAIKAAPTLLDRFGAWRWYQFVRMQIKVARQLNHIVTVSEFAKNDICSEFGVQAERIQVIGKGVDTSVFYPLDNVSRIPGRIITTTSSDQPLKGFSVLLEALLRLREKIPEAHLIVIGALNKGGANEARLKALALEPYVTFIKGISNQQLNEEYAKASAAACPSLYEGFGLPAIEAMACGVPVVSSDGGALAEVAGPAGIIAPAGNATSLSDALAKVLGSKSLQHDLRNRGLQHVKAHYHWPLAARQLTHYYHRAIAPACKPSAFISYS